MRAGTVVGLLLLGLLAGCGSDDLPGMRVICNHGASVQPLTRVDLRVQPSTAQAQAAAVLTYRDPLNRDQTSTLRVEPGDSCTISPATKVK